MNFNIGHIYFVILILFQSSFHLSASAEPINQTFQIKFSNEKWNEKMSNSSSLDYINKLISCQTQLNNTLQNNFNISLVYVINLTPYESNVVALTLIQSNGSIGKEQLNSVLSEFLNASLIFPSTVSTMSTTLSTMSTTLSTSYSSTSNSIPTTSTTNASLTSTLTSNSTTGTSLLVSSIANLSTAYSESSTQNPLNVSTSSIMVSSTVNTNSSVQLTSTTINSNFNYSISNMYTTPNPTLNDTATLNYTTNSNLNYTTTSDSSFNLTTSNPNLNMTTTNPNLNMTTTNPNLNMTTTNPNLNMTTTNPNLNMTTTNPNLNLTTQNPNFNLTTSDSYLNLSTSNINMTMTTSNTLPTTSTTSAIITTTFSVPLNNYSIRFLNDIWNNDYYNSSSEAYKNYINKLLDQLSQAFKIDSKYFTIYSLRPGSVIANIGIFKGITNIQIKDALPALSAEIVSSITTTASPISISTTISSGLPVYAIALISIFVIISIVSLTFIITAVTLRQRRLKGYGQHQIDFFEMENGWNYSTRNTVYIED